MKMDNNQIFEWADTEPTAAGIAWANKIAQATENELADANLVEQATAIPVEPTDDEIPPTDDEIAARAATNPSSNMSDLSGFEKERAVLQRRAERHIHSQRPQSRKPVGHHDFRLDIPMYQYIRPECLHLIFYRVPIPLGGLDAKDNWGYCGGCRAYFQHTASVREISARRLTAKRGLGKGEIDDALDMGIVCNRVANLIWARHVPLSDDRISDDDAKAMAKEAGCGTTTVYKVARVLGYGEHQLTIHSRLPLDPKYRPSSGTKRAPRAYRYRSVPDDNEARIEGYRQWEDAHRITSFPALTCEDTEKLALYSASRRRTAA